MLQLQCQSFCYHCYYYFVIIDISNTEHALLPMTTQHAALQLAQLTLLSANLSNFTEQ